MTRRLPSTVAVFVLLLARASHAQEASDDFRNVQREKPAPAEPAPAPANPETAPRPDAISPNATQPGPQPTDRPKKIFELTPFGYLRAGYDFTFKDPRFAFVGRNNGFVLDAARLGLDGYNADYAFAWRISIEGASDELSAPNTPIGSLSVRLRDAFVRWDPVDWAGLQFGQFKAPFQEEELRGTNTLLFASRSVGVEGVLPGRGFQTPGIALDRQLGVMLSPSKPIGGSIAASYYVMVMNGNGPNQILDDNGHLGVVGRTEVGYEKYARLGAAVFKNDRTVGDPPNLYNEEDFGLTGDLSVKVAGLQVFASITRLRTVFPTVGTSARVQLAYQAQAGYRFDLGNFFLTPAYRFAYFHPWQDGGGEGFDAYKLQYHTFGLRAGHAKLPVQAWLNYTLTHEEEGRKLENDRIELLGQVTF